ncbi:MAG: GLUG motif-containing protein [Christensenellales bacterium]
MKKIVTLVFVLLTLLAAAASAESYTQADFEWAEAVQDQSALTLKEQAKYLDIVKQRQRGIALLAMGGADTPFQIAGAAQLAELAQYVNAGDATFVSAHYVLTDDVNLSAYGNWTPIGTEDHPFEGVFDGQNHVVTGLKIDRSQGVCQGLFGYVSGTDDAHKAQIKNVAVRDAQIRARTEVGAVVGRYGQFTQGFVEPLENCAMIGGTIQGTSSMGQSSCVGGIVGRACGEIQRCYATGNIIGADNAIEYGGIVGETYKAVKACYWTGRLSALGSYADDFGGIAGSARGAVTNCYTTGDITGSLDNAATLGSIVGCAMDRVTNCYATGSVKGWRAIGGIAGQAYGDTYAHATISGCMALNTSVESNPFYSIGRVAGLTGQESVLNDNYAWDGMRVNGQKIPEGQQSVENGTDLTYDDTNGLSRQFETIFGGNSAWTYTENGLPTLKNVGGTQSSELPSWMLGSETTIYITTAQQLKRLADEVNAGDSKSGKTVLLMNDIDLSVYPNWSPIGTLKPNTSQVSYPFSGVVDGQNHTISNLTCTSNTNGYAGLFGNFDGTVQNLILRDAQITVEGLQAAAVVCENYKGQVLNCAMLGGSVKGKGVAGGVVCYNRGTVENCYATGDVTSLSGGRVCYAGGVVGYNYTEGTVQSCYAAGRVESEKHAGGAVGGNYGTVQNCVALGQSVSAQGHAHRVVGENTGGTLSGNYAWSGVQVNGQPVTDGLADNENGEDILVHDGLIYGKNAQIFAWPGFDTAVWELRNDQTGKLPRIRGTNADPTLGLSAQSIMVTCDVELNGDAGVSGFRYKVNDAANDTEYSGVFTVNLLDKLEIEPTIRTGYAFAQWSDGKTDNPYTMAVPGAVSLTAQTQIETYTIDYELNGGALEAGKTNPATYTLETAAFRLEEPTRTGYTFAGWTGSNGTTPQTDVGIAQGSTGSLYFEANWTANGYKILYTGVEGADVSTFPTKHVFGTDTAIPNPTKTDYSFAGWKVNGSAAARDLTLSGTAYTADIALEATWTKLTEPTPSVIMEGGTAFIVGKATEDAIMHIGKGVANFGVANLDSVDVDGKRLDPQFYTAKDGSIILTVHQAYLNTLSVGEHILTAHLKGPGYEGQTVSGKIVVAPVPDMSNLPQTGDASPVLLWGATLGLCAAVLAVMKRKKR